MPQLGERLEAVVFAERGAARLEERLRREHQDPQPAGGRGGRREAKGRARAARTTRNSNVHGRAGSTSTIPVLADSTRVMVKFTASESMTKPGLKTALIVVKAGGECGPPLVLFSRADISRHGHPVPPDEPRLDDGGAADLRVDAPRQRLALAAAAEVQRIQVGFGTADQVVPRGDVLQQLPPQQYRRRRRPRRRHRALHRLEDARDDGRAASIASSG